MRFTLHCRGKLPSNGSPAQKHALREAFHVQLSELWSNPPLNKIAGSVFLSNPQRVPLEFPIVVGDFPFVPLVTSVYLAAAELEIVLLRPEPPGRLITQGGDIDNRLKTLFDSLTIPKLNALPQGTQP